MPTHRATLLLYSLTIFLSAALLFLVQLVFARMVLPLLGGSPSVWNTAMVFYQAVLLAGYAYAHFLSLRLPVRAQVIVHTIVLAVPALFLPFVVPASAHPPADANPIPWLLWLLTAAVGVPFFAVSTTSPLLQKWFAATEHPGARDPYFLYAASNTGSLLGLLGYPFFIEPNSTLQHQGIGWTIGYVVLVVFCLACGLIAWRHAKGTVENKPAVPTRVNVGVAPTWPRRLRWVVCAFVPSSLMLSVTAYISSDIATVPLLWVLPLAVYLITFILVFAQRTIIPHAVAQRVFPLALVPVVMAIATGSTTPMSLLLMLHLVAFFLAALVCHGEVARDRPPAEHLTEFYLWLSVGGVLGGAFNALLAPLIFDGVFEYHLALVAAAFLGVPRGDAVRATRSRWLDVLLPVGLALLAVVLLLVIGVQEEETRPVQTFIVFGVPTLLCFLMSRRRFRFALGLAAVLLVSNAAPGRESLQLEAARSFFGVHRVTMDSGRKFHRLIHGKTIHGMQSLDPAKRRVPLTYYHPSGPLGQIFAAWDGRLNGPIAAVGLGAGATAAYGKPGQELTFFEIDPVVKRIASDPKYFTYLSDSPARINVVLGDARLSLQSAADAHFQFIILDAYSSDSIPVHLITREALQLYLRKLAPEGLIALHISNLHMDLRPVVANLAHDAGMVCLLEDDSEPADEEIAAGKTQSQWALLARSESDLAPVLDDRRWRRDAGDPALRVWTYDYSSIVSVLNFGLR